MRTQEVQATRGVHHLPRSVSMGAERNKQDTIAMIVIEQNIHKPTIVMGAMKQ